MLGTWSREIGRRLKTLQTRAVTTPGAVGSTTRALWLVVYLYVLTPVHYPQKFPRMTFLVGLALASWLVVMASRRRDRYQMTDRVSAFVLGWSGVVLWALLWFMTLGTLAMTLPQLLAFQPGLLLALLAGLGLLLVFEKRLKLVRRGWLTAFTPVWMSQVALLAVMATHFSGSSDAECRQVADNPLVRPLLSRTALNDIPGLNTAFPYDSAYVVEEDRVFVTLKDRLAGYLSTTDPPGTASNGLLMIRRSDSAILAFHGIRNQAGSSLPQNLLADASTRSVVTYVVDRQFRHSVRTWTWDGDRLSKAATRVFESFEAGAGGRVGEPDGLLPSAVPGRVLVDLYRGSRGWLWEADLPHLDNERFTPVDSKFSLLDKMARDPLTGQVVVASNHGGVLFLDGTSLAVLDSVWTADPVSSVAVDPDSGDVIAAGIVAGELIRIDHGTHEIVGRRMTVRVPRSLAIAPEPGLLFVSGYVEGILRVHDLDTLEALADIPVGTVARTIHHVPELDVVSVNSSCGVLEIDVTALVRQLGRRSE